MTTFLLSHEELSKLVITPMIFWNRRSNTSASSSTSRFNHHFSPKPEKIQGLFAPSHYLLSAAFFKCIFPKFWFACRNIYNTRRVSFCFLTWKLKITDTKQNCSQMSEWRKTFASEVCACLCCRSYLPGGETLNCRWPRLAAPSHARWQKRRRPATRHRPRGPGTDRCLVECSPWWWENQFACSRQNNWKEKHKNTTAV